MFLLNMHAFANEQRQRNRNPIYLFFETDFLFPLKISTCVADRI